MEPERIPLGEIVSALRSIGIDSADLESVKIGPDAVVVTRRRRSDKTGDRLPGAVTTSIHIDRDAADE